MARELRRKTPEECMAAVHAEEAAAAHRGHLKVVLGYASGVGKSFRMLDEARRRRERGQDIVVGAVQPKVPAEVDALLEKLEVIPLTNTGGGMAIDLDGILRRHPEVCIIDGLAYDNPPGARNPTRWQDVQELLKLGTKVIASINVQYVAEVQDRVQAITGKRSEQTVPMSFIQSADEIELVDAPAIEPAGRSPEERAAAARQQERLSKLRELALTLAADVVEHQLNTYLEQHGILQHFGAHEKILVCVTPRANVKDMMDEARIVADRFHGALIAAYVRQANITAEDQESLDSRLAIARAAGATVEILEGADPARTLLEFARSRGITQLYVGHSQRGGMARFRGGPLDKLIWEGRGMDVRVFPQ